MESRLSDSWFCQLISLLITPSLQKQLKKMTRFTKTQFKGWKAESKTRLHGHGRKKELSDRITPILSGDVAVEVHSTVFGTIWAPQPTYSALRCAAAKEVKWRAYDFQIDLDSKGCCITLLHDGDGMRTLGSVIEYAVNNIKSCVQ